MGAPLVTSDAYKMGTGSVFGLVKWSPDDRFAVTARPELIRDSVFLGCGPTTCNSEARSRGRVSLGVEAGGVPGLVLTAAIGAVLLLGLVALGAFYHGGN